MIILRYICVLLLCIVVTDSHTSPAYAQELPAAVDTTTRSTMPDACMPGSEVKGYSHRVTMCVRESVIAAVNKVMTILSAFMVPVFSGLATLAIAIFGIRVMGGEQQISKQSIGFIIRFAIILWFLAELQWFSQSIFSITDQLIHLVTGAQWTPWQQIDAFLGKLLGFGQDQHGGKIMLFNGVIGLLGGSLFSSTFGLMLFMMGISAIISIVLFIFQVVYLYLTSIVVIGFLIIISPLIIPFAIFYYSEKYFRQWLQLLMATMLTPMMMFAFLFIFLNIFDLLIADIFEIVPSDSLPAYLRTDQPLLSWLMPADADVSKYMQSIQVRPEGASPNAIFSPPIQTNMDVMARNSISSNIGNPPLVYFGANDTGVKQNLIYTFVTLWIFSTLMKSMLTAIPGIASSIAGSRGAGISFSAGPLQQGAERIQNQLTNAARQSATPTVSRPAASTSTAQT